MAVEIWNVGPAIIGPVGTPLAELLECDAAFECAWCGHIERGRGFEPNHAMIKHLRTHSRTFHSNKALKARHRKD